jgi:hypothetical protein
MSDAYETLFYVGYMITIVCLVSALINVGDIKEEE